MFESLFGGMIFLNFFVLGAVFGLAFEVCKIFKRISKNNIFIVNTINFVYFCILGMFYCGFVLRLCSGVIHPYTIVAVVSGIIIEQICIGFFFTKFYDLLYNVCVKLVAKAKRTKLGNKILR